MADIAVDFTNVRERGDYEPGTYTFEIRNAELKHGPNGPYVRLQLQFTEGKYAGLYTEEIVSLSENALWRARLFLKAVGYDVPKGPFRFRTEDLVELRFRADCVREVDESGKYPPKLRVQTYHIPDGSPAPVESGNPSHMVMAEPSAAIPASVPAETAASTIPTNGRDSTPPPPPALTEPATTTSPRPKVRV